MQICTLRLMCSPMQSPRSSGCARCCSTLALTLMGNGAHRGQLGPYGWRRSTDRDSNVAVRGSQEDGMAPPSPSGGRTAVPSFRLTNIVTPSSDAHAVR